VREEISPYGRCRGGRRRPTVSRIATQPNTFRTPVSLTPAESRVLTLLATYRTLAAIGEELDIGRATVKTHVQHIYKKLGVSTRAGAVKRAEHAGWITARKERP
jgi:DNA-binding NarL/FixJ family response regulator